MRPMRFEEFAVELASKDPAAGKASTLRDAGDSKRPFGLAVALEGREARFQFNARSAPGDQYDQPERPDERDPVSLDGPWAEGPEGWLARLLAGSGSREIASVEQWSLREDAKKGHHGVTVHFHDGARIFARAL
ncbi:hypothetical protein ACWGMA_08270 [Streptomyces asiaticus]